MAEQTQIQPLEIQTGRKAFFRFAADDPVDPAFDEQRQGHQQRQYDQHGDSQHFKELFHIFQRVKSMRNTPVSHSPKPRLR